MKRMLLKTGGVLALASCLSCSQSRTQSPLVEAKPGAELAQLQPPASSWDGLWPEPAIRRSSAASSPSRGSAQAQRSPLIESAQPDQVGDARPTEQAPRDPDVIYVPTPQPVVDKMLQMAELRPGQVVYDLGCGDGRIVVTAAKRYGVRAFGFDIDPDRVAEAKDNVRRNGVEHLVTIEQRDIFQLDLSRADVVTLYLLPELNARLIPQLRQLERGSRIVSHDFPMEPIDPDEVAEVEYGGREHLVYLWTAPLEE